MGHKVHPKGLRLGINLEWSSSWFSTRSFKNHLREDVLLKKFLWEKLKRFSITEINMERLSGGRMLVSIYTAKPGLLIGRGGGGVEELRKAIRRKLGQIRRTSKVPADIKVEIQEVSNPDGQAAILAQSVADQLEKRLPFQRVIERTLERAMAAKGILGAKIMVAGRLGGSEMKRREKVSGGKIPLQTIRANIDYATAEARTTWGVIGVKVWLYKGEIFSEKEKRDR